jgi:hypothetical protein
LLPAVDLADGATEEHDAMRTVTRIIAAAGMMR